MAGDYQASYEFTTPGYRSTEGVIRYGTRWAGVGMWISANVIKADCDGSGAGRSLQSCWFKWFTEAPGYEPVTTALTEDWLLIDDSGIFIKKLSE